MRCFLDMDGVIADFVGGVVAVHGCSNPYDIPANRGEFDMETLLGMSPEAFWEPTNNEAFWANLPKTAEADDLVSRLTNSFGVNSIAILTTPSRSAWCFTGKRLWIENNFPQFADSVIYCGAKGLLAAPGHFLIDDRDRNLREFKDAGGHAIGVPRPWNKQHRAADRVLEVVSFQLSVHLDG